GVFLALQVPDVFPVGAFLQTGGLVAQSGEDGAVLVGDQVRDDLRQVGVWRVEGSDGDDAGVGGEAVGQARQGQDAGLVVVVEPQVTRLHAVEQPRTQSLLLHGVPALGRPATLVLGAFDHADGTIRLDHLDTTLDDLLVGLRPVGWNLGHWCAAVSNKPFTAGLASSNLASKHNLESTFARNDVRNVVQGRGDSNGCQTIVCVDLPVQFFLESDHSAPCQVEQIAPFPQVARVR